jgi:hypothetical protein
VRRVLRSLLVQVAVVDPVAALVAAVAEAHPEDEADPPAAAAVSHEADRLAVAVAAAVDSRGADVAVVVALAAVDAEDTKRSGGFSLLWYHPGPHDYQPIPRSFDGVWELNWVFLYMWNIGAMLKIRKTDAMSIGKSSHLFNLFTTKTCNTTIHGHEHEQQQTLILCYCYYDTVETSLCKMQASQVPTRRLD